MRFLEPLFVFLTVAALHCAFSASLESAEKEEKVAQYDGLTELQKRDQMEFEAAQKREAAQMNGTETESSEDVHYLEAAQDESEEEHVESEVADSAEGGNHSDTAAHEETESDSSEEDDERRKRDHHAAGSDNVSSRADEVCEQPPKEQDVTE